MLLRHPSSHDSLTQRTIARALLPLLPVVRRALCVEILLLRILQVYYICNYTRDTYSVRGSKLLLFLAILLNDGAKCQNFIFANGIELAKILTREIIIISAIR